MPSIKFWDRAAELEEKYGCTVRGGALRPPPPRSQPHVRPQAKAAPLVDSRMSGKKAHRIRYQHAST
jgi:hypothetical protein